MKSTLILASSNLGKVKEIKEFLSACPFTIEIQSDFDVPEIIETGRTFIENAIIKARHAAEVTGLPVIADDSGLVVDALMGKPGVHSARYAGFQATSEDNLAKLLGKLRHIPEASRSARFFCVMVFLRFASDPVPIICQGVWEGQLLLEPRGQKGFGYDPIFYLPKLGKTAAELTVAEKNKLSHRGQALQQLQRYLTAFVEDVRQCDPCKTA